MGLQNDEWDELMRENFVDEVNIADDFEYLPADDISEMLGDDIELDGFGFANGQTVTSKEEALLVFVDARGLPEHFTILALQPGVGAVASETTHESGEAADIASAFMRRDFEESDS